MTEINNNNQFNNLPEEEGLSISDIIGLVTRHIWWYVGMTLICLCVAGFKLYKTPTLYNRTAKVIVDDSNQDAAMRNLGMASANMMRRAFSPIANEMEAFASPNLMQIVVERLGLQTKYVEKQFMRDVELYHNSPIQLALVEMNPTSGFSFLASPAADGQVRLSEFSIRNNEISETVTGNYGDTLVTPVGSVVIYAKENIADFKDDIRVSWTNSTAMAKAYAGRLNVALSGRESSIVSISLTDQFPSRAEAVLATLLDVYDEEWISNKNRSAINTTQFLNERLVVIEQDLNAVENALKEYKANNNLVDVKAEAQNYMSQSNVYATKAFEMANQISVAQYIKDYLNNPANANTLIPSNLGLTNVNVEGQIQEYNQLVLQKDRLLVGSSINNPMIVDITASLASIRTAILSSIDNMIATLNLQLEKVKSQEKQILSRISSSTDQELELLSLEREQQMIQNLYMFLLQKREENELAALVNVGNTRLIMSPSGSSAPVSPDRKMFLLAALVIGCGIPFAFFFVKKMLDTSVKNRGDLGNVNVPFLAELPLYVRNKGRFHNLKRNKQGDDKNVIIVKSGSRDMMNEAFRVLRTNVDLIIGRRTSSQVLMLTSFNPGAGKTFTTMNLAASMALKGAKVLMLDLDLRRASLSKDLGVVHTGVAAYLNGTVEDYRTCVDQISDNLFLLPVGTLPPNPTELLLTPRFKEMIAQMREEYDYIFVDCPPIEVVADASIITEVVDMTIFVMRAGQIDKRALPSLEDLYANNKYQHMTMILNAVDIRTKRYGYGKGGYGYGYGYGYGDSAE